MAHVDTAHPVPTRPRRLDRQTIRRARARSPSALNVFFEHYFDRVHRYVGRLVCDRPLAEDLTQETFLRLHQSIDRLDPDRDPSGWVFTVATNVVRDYWRSFAHRVSMHQVELGVLRDVAASGDVSGPDRDLERKDDMRTVRLALAELPRSDREILILRSYRGLVTTEIARALGTSTAAARQRYSRALSRLGKTLRRMMEPGSGVMPQPTQLSR